MKIKIGIVLLLLGALLMLYGLAWAVIELARMYGSALQDPLNGQVDAKKTSSSMLTAALIGIGGFVPMTIGSLMLGNGLLGYIKKRLTPKP